MLCFNVYLNHPSSYGIGQTRHREWKTWTAQIMQTMQRHFLGVRAPKLWVVDLCPPLPFIFYVLCLAMSVISRMAADIPKVWAVLSIGEDFWQARRTPNPKNMELAFGGWTHTHTHTTDGFRGIVAWIYTSNLWRSNVNVEHGVLGQRETHHRCKTRKSGRTSHGTSALSYCTDRTTENCALGARSSKQRWLQNPVKKPDQQLVGLSSRSEVGLEQ